MINSQKIAIISQCRLSSKRLKKKILLKVNNKSLLNYLCERFMNVNCDKIIFALADDYGSNIIKKNLEKYNKKIFFSIGSTKNVLLRTIKAAEDHQIENVIRITSDCPLFDPNIVNMGIDMFKKNEVDYLSNNLIKSFAHGLDFEIIKTDALKKSLKECHNKNNLEHVTWYIRKSKRFKKMNIVNNNKSEKKIRITLDYLSDYKFMKTILNNYPICKKNYKWAILKNSIKDYSNKKL